MLSEAKALLQRGKELLDSDVENLNTLLHRLKVQELKMLAKEVRVRLTGSLKKDDIIERMMGMACIGALQYESDARSDNIRTISYLDEDTKCVIRSLPAFASVTQWDKKLAGVLMEFTFMNLVLCMEETRRLICKASRHTSH